MLHSGWLVLLSRQLCLQSHIHKECASVSGISVLFLFVEYKQSNTIQLQVRLTNAIYNDSLLSECFQAYIQGSIIFYISRKKILFITLKNI